MRLHETWTGAANPGDKTYAVGSVEGIGFTAYASGCNIIILSSNFERVQIIPGICHDNIQISCLDCSVETGKIAAAYDNKVVIFEPTPLRSSEIETLQQGLMSAKSSFASSIRCGLDYWWVETGHFESHCCVTTLAWNNDSLRLITAGEVLQLWEFTQESSVKFAVGPSEDPPKSHWHCIWKTRPANPIHFLSFSPDGALFATAAKHDRLVRIWYQNHQFSSHGGESQNSRLCDITFSYIYLAHPRSVTGISWRKTSRFMPRGSVANMLVTSCLDNICRLWSETHLPEDAGILHSLNDENSEASGIRTSAKHRIQKQKARFVQRFRHMRQSFAARNLARSTDNHEPVVVSVLPSTYSSHDQHRQQTFIFSPGLHFHLAATINAVGDIPLVPTMSTVRGSNVHKNRNFVLHWMNNKEMEFSLQAEKILEDLCLAAMSHDDNSHLELELAKMEGIPIPKPSSLPDETLKSLSLAKSSSAISGRDASTINGSTISLDQSEHGSSGGGGTTMSRASLAEILDHRVDAIIKEWHHSSDLLFAIHPIDGSLLVWVADFLDEYQPGAFRQTQISFSSRIPNAIPLGDASTMSSSVCIYNAEMPILRDLFKMAAAEAIQRAEMLKAAQGRSIIAKEVGDGDGDSDVEMNDDGRAEEADEELQKKGNDKKAEMNSAASHAKYKPAPVVKMISKHRNGTLNLWSVTFADKSKFSSLLNINHKARASGHRFRVNDIVCHPVLPLLLTTSHHNVVKRGENGLETANSPDEVFCSELILWRVDPVGPLSKSGGITELARINSHEISAFSDVAWIPTLLPSSTLGPAANSPSACFVASDGHSLRVYQAVIDARTLLAELSANNSSQHHDTMSVSSDNSQRNFNTEVKITEKLKIISTQSTARPGAVVELEPIADAKQDWQRTMLLHAFQEHVISDQGLCTANPTELGLIPSKMSAIVDLQQTTGGKFHEPFYVLVVEKTDDNGAIMHVWRLVLASEGEGNVGEDVDSSGSVSPSEFEPNIQPQFHHKQICEIQVSTEKVCSQKLPLPSGVEVIHAVPAVGHLSSSSIFPACSAPYTIVTACSDQTIRFWHTKAQEAGKSGLEWEEWKMESSDGDSRISVPGKPVSISAAYTGRLAVAYQAGTTFSRKAASESDKLRYVNLCVAIYECESTGGSEWICEDRIHLKNIELRSAVLPPVDLSVYHDHTEVSKIVHNFQDHMKHTKVSGLTSVPSLSTLEGVKKYISEMGNTPSAIAPKQTVMLDWVSKEDGTHLLTITVGNKVLLLTAVSSDIAQANLKALSDARTAPSNRPLLRKSSSIGLQSGTDEVRWMQIRRIELKTADGLSPLPMSSAWVRDGLFLIGMDSEFAVYSQWRGREETAQTNADTSTSSGKDFVDHRHLQETDLLNMAQDTQLRSVMSTPHFPAGGGTKPLSDIEKRKKVIVSPTNDTDSSGDDALLKPDFGLFEASHLACPVLPQYHPKQLMELLNSGKIRWVKAILAHLVRCISGVGSHDRIRFKSGGSFNEDGSRSPRNWSRSRTLSVSYPGGALSPGGFGIDKGLGENRSSLSGIPEEVTLDYTQINSIPPLPLWTLLAADKENISTGKEDKKAYDDLFHGTADEENLDDLLEDDFDTGISDRNRRRMSSGGNFENQAFSHFGPRQARSLSKLLTHAHLPGLSSLDQMHLLALADTVASCKINLSDRFAIDAAKAAISKETATSSGGEPTPESLDDCGLRFLLAMKHFSYLQRCLPLSQRAQLQRQGLASSNIIWGYHSESEEELLNMIPSVSKGTPSWNELRELGVAWWVKNDSTLKKLFEKVAKAAFQEKQDPLDAAIFYLAMKKKSLVWGLYRSVRDDKMTAFFSNNFAEERWRQAALKNAFVLLGKQRFLHAAAFFLLSGSLKDAIEVCIDKLDDLQLAMVIARLYDNGLQSESIRKILYQHVLGGEDQNNDLSKAHPDPFLRSIALWTVKEYSGSLATLVQSNVGEMHPKFNKDEAVALSRKKTETDPSVFNFYVYLRTHPLLTRHAITVNSNKKAGGALMLTGFRGAKSVDQETGPITEDAVTPLERRLYFSTAHYHLRAGCPALAVEVLSKLPSKVSERKQSEPTLKSKDVDSADNACLETGTFDMDWSQPVEKTHKKEEKTKGLFDEPSEDMGLDWSTPASEAKKEDDDELKLEWSDDPETEDDDLPVSESVKRIGSIKKKSGRKNSTGQSVFEDEDDEGDSTEKVNFTIDVTAQQLKFIACLKIMMEELSTLATGFEVDGGLLRYQLYIWLEREVEALKQLCNYGQGATLSTNEATARASERFHHHVQEISQIKGRVPTLHEVMLAERAEFEAKVQQGARRKSWLKANHTLLRTLLSYCSLRGANGGGLASVRMELILLLQELQQENTQKQLLSPLPFHTTLPLLSACIAQQKTVVADPIRHLQSLTHDMLITVVDRHRPPPFPGMLCNYSSVFLLRDMSVALSSCIYQSLSDSDSINIKKLATTNSAVLEALSRLSVVYQDSSLISSTARKMSCDNTGIPDMVTTEPSKWPGVASLRALLDREKDEEAPNLNVLLCESFVAIYIGLLSYALATCDAHILYRLVGQKMTPQAWASIFGGGTKKILPVTTNSQIPGSSSYSNSHADLGNSQDSGEGAGSDPQSILNTVTSITKQRVKLNFKVLGVQLGQQGQDATSPSAQTERQTYREQFTPPEMSIVSRLMNKPILDGPNSEIDYDSGGESDTADGQQSDFDDDDDDPFSNAPAKKENLEHSNPNSYSWCLIRYACIKLAQENLEKFLTIAGIELAAPETHGQAYVDRRQGSFEELPVASPLIYACLRVTERWTNCIVEKLNAFGQAPENFIPGCYPNPAATGPALQKYKSLLEIANTPFPANGHGLGPIKRLWQYLVRQETVQKIFVKYIFGRKQKLPSSSQLIALADQQLGLDLSVCNDHYLLQQMARIYHPVKIIHKEHDSISAFCINKVSTGLMSVATQKELQELNISLLLNPSSWIEGMNDEADFDVLNLNEDPESLPSSNYLVTQTPGDPIYGMQPVNPGASGSSAASQLSSPNGQPPPFGPTGQGTGPQSGRGNTVGFMEMERESTGFNPFGQKLKGHNFPGSQNPQFCRLVIHRSRHLLKPVKKHKVDGIRRMAAHSHLPLYVTGCQDGSVRMWEWSHVQPVQNVRPPGVFAKVNRVCFSHQGNKFGACDADGNVALWQAANASQPFFNYQCHSKQTSDFVFHGSSSSLFCTAGHSADGKNVALWDTLLPQKRAMVQGFTFHENGASAISCAPRHNQLITAGKKGTVAIWDMRQQRQLHFFKAHDHPIKCFALGPDEDIIITGCVDGDIKVWSLQSYKCIHTFPQEHARHGIFKNISQGVSQVYVDQYNRLFSCGADGSIKVRQLPDADFLSSF